MRKHAFTFCFNTVAQLYAPNSVTSGVSKNGGKVDVIIIRILTLVLSPGNIPSKLVT